ncbi:hypothetical protein GIB67_010819 [Kingdonia uniflora]|uniref:DUF8039 domain-containing protein n=1 Tax=Kingdonia uniflora TaxID=39325 RepID=A0A7J7L923_9MAGN|nr:hypothetical protein GIB67_010819 [Kingdonia uniflora]
MLRHPNQISAQNETTLSESNIIASQGNHIPSHSIKCKLFWLTPSNVVATGHWYNEEPKCKVHNVPLGIGMSKVCIQIALKEDVPLARWNDHLKTIGDECGSFVSWPTPFIIKEQDSTGETFPKKSTLLLDAFNKDKASLPQPLLNPSPLAPFPVLAPPDLRTLEMINEKLKKAEVLGSVSNVAPWMLTVAASSTDRRIIDKGNVVNAFDMERNMLPLILGEDASDYCNNYDAQ